MAGPSGTGLEWGVAEAQTEARECSSFWEALPRSASEEFLSFTRDDDAPAEGAGFDCMTRWATGGAMALEVLACDSWQSLSQTVAALASYCGGLPNTWSFECVSFKRKHTNFRTQWSFPDDFPSAAVIDAFHRPEVDRSLEPFAWAPVDLRRAVVQLQKSCDLTEEKILERLEPAVRRYEDTLRQPRITEYMIPSDAGDVAVVRSSRMQRALRGLRGESPEPEDEGQAADAGEAEAEGLSRRRRRRNEDVEGSVAPRARGRGRGRRGRGRRASQAGAAAAFASLGGAACAEIDLGDSE
eukprot:s541_g15.t1